MSEIDYSVVLDKNERDRMLQEGYTQEVIEWQARKKWEKLRDDFLWKNTILKSHFEQSPYYDFMSDVFAGVEKLVVVTGERSYTQMDVDDLMNYQSVRNDVYVPPASFINGYYSGTGCKDILALVVDLDGIDPETLKNILENGNIGDMTPLPTYIVNSGSGVHFYYVFKEPVPHYHCNRPILKSMYKRLCMITKKNIKARTDRHALTQPFRLPGSQTKLGQTATGWKSGDKWGAHEFAHRLGVDSEKLDLQQRPLLSQKEYHAEKERRMDERGPAKKGKRQWKSSLDGNVGFYEYCLERCFEETQEGTRYNSLVGMTVVAYKVRLGHTPEGRERLERDLLRLVAHYNKIGKRMRPKEAAKALRAYNPEADRCRSETLEEWFGWEFRRDAKKRREERKEKHPDAPVLSRAEILEDARLIRDIRMRRLGRKWDDGNGRKPGSGSKEQEVRSWRIQNPNGKPADCIRETGISKNTVYKWWGQKTLVVDPAEQGKKPLDPAVRFDWRALLEDSTGMPFEKIEEIVQKYEAGTLSLEDFDWEDEED